jgi:hypothetical protein
MLDDIKGTNQGKTGIWARLLCAWLLERSRAIEVGRPTLLYDTLGHMLRGVRSGTLIRPQSRDTSVQCRFVRPLDYSKQ